jgi:hypothetical protein
MVKNSLFIILIILSAANVAKGEILFEPNPLCLPLLANGPAVQGGLYYSGHSFMDGSLAFSLNKRVRIFADYFKNDDEYTENTAIFNDLKHYAVSSWYGEMGIGCRIGKVDQKQTVTDVFCGTGKGYVFQKEYFPNVADAPTENEGKYNKIFLQINHGREKSGFNLVFGGRVMYIWYPYCQSIYYYNLGTSYASADTVEHKNVSFINIEPALQLEVGPKWLKGFAQFGISTCVRPYKTSYSNGGIFIYEETKIGGAFYKVGLTSTIDLSFGKRDE